MPRAQKCGLWYDPLLARDGSTRCKAQRTVAACTLAPRLLLQDVLTCQPGDAPPAAPPTQHQAQRTGQPPAGALQRQQQQGDREGAAGEEGGWEALLQSVGVRPLMQQQGGGRCMRLGPNALRQLEVLSSAGEVLEREVTCDVRRTVGVPDMRALSWRRPVRTWDSNAAPCTAFRGFVSLQGVEC